MTTSLPSLDPATGEVLGNFDATHPSALPGLLARARRAQADWASTAIRARCSLLGSLRNRIYERRRELADAVIRETGKPRVEALFVDLFVTLDSASYYATFARDMLQPERVQHHSVAVKAKTGRVFFEPYGAIAVIGAWNYPLAIPMAQMIPAVVAGNAVILKPSELTPWCGALIGELFEQAGFPPGLVQIAQGGGELGQALIAAGPDKVIFTGSVATGKLVAESCARRLIPCVLELGGKDAMIVLGDADVEVASRAAGEVGSLRGRMTPRKRPAARPAAMISPSRGCMVVSVAKFAKLGRMPEAVDYLIIGGGPAGTNAAEGIRANDANGRILIVTAEPYPYYHRMSLPHFVKGTKTRDQLFLWSPERYQEKKIELWVKTSVVKLDPISKVATLSDGRTVRFQKVLLSSGGTPYTWNVPGSDKKGVQRLNTLDQAQAIIDLLPSIQEMVIIGGGFISLEFCGIAGQFQKKATVLVLEPYYWANLLDETSGNLISKYLTKNGITVRTNQEVAEVLGQDKVTGVKSKKGEEIPAQMIGVGIGVKRNLEFLAGTPVKVEKGVVTNEFLESSVPDVWAAGDVAEFKDSVIGKRHMLGNWNNASDQGRRVGPNMSGQKAPFEGVSAYSITTFDLNVTFLGDPKPDGAEIIERGDRESNFGRIFVVEDRIIGATLIARLPDKAPLTALIRQKTLVDARLKAVLADHTKPIPMSVS